MPDLPTPLRALIYCRLSSDKDGQGRSVAEQEAECRAECARRGWTVVDVLVDRSHSATRWARKDRPAYAEVAQRLAADEADILVTWEASRGQRDLTAYTALRDLSAANGVHWSYSGRLYDMGDDDDRFATGLDALVGEREGGLIRKRVLRAVTARAAIGKVHGRMPDGYRAVRDPHTGHVVARELDPERAPLLQEAARRLLAGESAWTIAADLNRRGHTTRSGKPWTGANLVGRLRPASLCGRRVFRGEVTDVEMPDWPKLLSEHDYDRLQAVLNDPARRTTRNGNRVTHQGAGIYLCGVCGAPMRSLSAKRRDGSRQFRYDCSARHCVARDALRVDEVVDWFVVEFLSRPDVFAELTDTDDAAVLAAQAEAARLRGLLDDARAKVTSGAISLEDFAMFRRGWETDLAAAEERARPTWVPQAALDVAGPDARARWAEASIERRRTILKGLFVVAIHRQTGPRFDPAAVTVRRRSNSGPTPG